MQYKTKDHSDLSLFGNRLWKLMKEKNIKTPNALATELYNRGLATVKHRKDTEFSYDSEEKNKAIESIKKKIEKHLDSEKADCLQGEFAIAYCKYFGCSADYLYGVIEYPTHAHTDISNEIGLNESAIDILKKANSSPIINDYVIALNLINYLLDKKEKGFNDRLDLMHLLSNYLFISNDISSFTTVLDNESPTMEEESICLFDKYGQTRGSVPVNKMSNIYLLSINETLTKMRTTVKQTYNEHPNINHYLHHILDDTKHLHSIYKQGNTEIIEPLRKRINENTKRLIYLFNIDSFDDIDVDDFRNEYTYYTDDDIKILEKELYFDIY